MSAPTIDLNDGLHCPVCEQAFAMDDLCATDIEMGVCHAACLEGAAVVDLETGEPKDGKIDTYRFASLFSEAEIDEMALDAFAAAMRDKLARKRDEGRGGWHDKADCTNEHLSDLLRRHVEKGDPIDVANLAMMIHQRGERIDAYVPGSWEAEERLTVAEAWTILCETPDITSPEEYPDHALITMEQLGSFMERATPKRSTIRVKALVWERGTNEGSFRSDEFRLARTSRGWGLLHGWPGCLVGVFDSAEAGMEAAQEIHDEYIRSQVEGGAA